MSDGKPPKKKLGAYDPSVAGAAIDPHKEVRVLIAEDNAYMREHLRGMLEEDGMIVVGEAADGLNRFVRVLPEVVRVCPHPDRTLWPLAKDSELVAIAFKIARHLDFEIPETEFPVPFGHRTKCVRRSIAQNRGVSEFAG